MTTAKRDKLIRDIKDSNCSATELHEVWTYLTERLGRRVVNFNDFVNEAHERERQQQQATIEELRREVAALKREQYETSVIHVNNNLPDSSNVAITAVYHAADNLGPDEVYELINQFILKLQPDFDSLTIDTYKGRNLLEGVFLDGYWEGVPGGWNANNRASAYLQPIDRLQDEINSVINRIIGFALGGFGTLTQEQIRPVAGNLSHLLGDLDMAIAAAEGKLKYTVLDQSELALATDYYEAARDYAANLNDGSPLRKLIAERDELGQTEILTRQQYLPGPDMKETIQNQWLYEYARTHKDDTGDTWEQTANHLITVKDDASFTVEQRRQLNDLALMRDPTTYLTKGWSHLKKRQKELPNIAKSLLRHQN